MEFLTIETVGFVIASYLGAIVAFVVLEDAQINDKKQSIKILLYGTVGWIAGFLIKIFMLDSGPELATVTIFAIFAISGLMSYTLLTILSNLIKTYEWS